MLLYLSWKSRLYSVVKKNQLFVKIQEYTKIKSINNLISFYFCFHRVYVWLQRRYVKQFITTSGIDVRAVL